MKHIWSIFNVLCYCVSGIRMFQHSALNATEQAKDNRFARTLEYANNINDIYSCSWGLLDIYGYDIGYMAPVVHDVIRKSTEQVVFIHCIYLN